MFHVRDMQLLPLLWRHSVSVVCTALGDDGPPRVTTMTVASFIRFYKDLMMHMGAEDMTSSRLRKCSMTASMYLRPCVALSVCL